MNTYPITPVPKPTEADVTRAIRDLLGVLGIFHWKQWQGPMSHPKGVSDILGCWNGKMLAIEVKRPGWKPPQTGTKAHMHYLDQLKFINNIKRSGGIAFFARSVGEAMDELGVRDRFSGRK